MTYRSDRLVDKAERELRASPHLRVARLRHASASAASIGADLPSDGCLSK